ncbi:MAG: DUF4492 domain-containing protein [Bacteroidales bacterium]|nr:DUF4492 domain-containing protein [Bacteroidales bacterium]
MNIAKKVFLFYYEGFKNMSLTSRKLWLIVLIKLFVMFVVLKLFFFNKSLKTIYNTDEERSDHVFRELTIPNN